MVKVLGFVVPSFSFHVFFTFYMFVFLPLQPIVFTLSFLSMCVVKHVNATY